MTKKTDTTPVQVVTLEQIEAELAQHGEAAQNLTALRDDLLHREQREQLLALQGQLQNALRGKDGAKETYEKAKAAAKKSEKRHKAVLEKEQAARRAVGMAELTLRQLEDQIAALERHING